MAVAAALAGLVVLLGWWFQDRLIYLPSGRAGTPEEVALPGAAEVEVHTEDGLTLTAWFVRARRRFPSGAVLVLPGNAGNRSLRAPLAAALADEGFDVLLVDYRGYGGNPGRPSQDGLLADARAARAVLLDESRVEQVAYFGESLGAGVATALAVEEPPDALVLRSPFTSLEDIARVHYGWLPVGVLLRDRFEVEEQVGEYDGPVLVIAGARDSIVPPQQSRRVAEEAPQSQYVEIAGADHNDAALLAGADVVDAVVAFLRSEGFSDE